MEECTRILIAVKSALRNQVRRCAVQHIANSLYNGIVPGRIFTPRLPGLDPSHEIVKSSKEGLHRS